MSNIPIARPYLRGVIHCHSQYSYDSLTSISVYLKVAQRQNLDFIILTEHDTIAGSQALKAAAGEPATQSSTTDRRRVPNRRRRRNRRVHRRRCGARNFRDFVTEVRVQNGLPLLPHPYVGHRAPEKLAAACDLIEVFNCRTRESKNSWAYELARSLGKHGYAGADAHFARSICGAVIADRHVRRFSTARQVGKPRGPPRAGSSEPHS